MLRSISRAGSLDRFWVLLRHGPVLLCISNLGTARPPLPTPALLPHIGQTWVTVSNTEGLCLGSSSTSLSLMGGMVATSPAAGRPGSPDGKTMDSLIPMLLPLPLT